MDLIFRRDPWSDSIDKKLKILILTDEKTKILENIEEKYLIFNKIFNLEKIFDEDFNKTTELDAVILSYDINNKNIFEKIKKLFEVFEKVNLKILIGNLGINSEKNLEEKNRKISKEEAENLAKKYNFNYFECNLLSHIGIKEIEKLILSKIYSNYYSKEEEYKIYKINDLLSNFFDGKMKKENYISEIKKIINQANKFEEIKIDENEILNETFNLFSKKNQKLTLNEFIYTINKLDAGCKKEFLISCLINNIIYKGKLSSENENDKIALEVIKSELEMHSIKEEDIISFEFIYNYYKDDEIIFSYKKNNCNYKNELIPKKVNKSNEKYKLKLESIFKEKVELFLNKEKKLILWLQKSEKIIKKNISKKLLDNYNDPNHIYMDEFYSIKKILEKITDEFYTIKQNFYDKNDLLEKKVENFVNDNKIIKKEEEVYKYHENEKEKKYEFKYILDDLDKKSNLVKLNEKTFSIISENNIKIYDVNYKLVTNIKIPIKNYIILNNGDILLKAESSNYMQFIESKTFKITKKYFLFSQNSIPLYSINDGRIFLQNYNHGVYIYESKENNNNYIMSHFINQIAIGIHQLNDDSIILFKYGCMIQYSTKDFKMMNVLENKYGNCKALNFNDDICIVYGGDPRSPCSQNIIYFIDRKKFKILSCFDSKSVVRSMISKKNMLYTYLDFHISGYKQNYTLNIYKIKDAENVYSDTEKLTTENIGDIIEINNKILSIYESCLISFDI